LFDIHEVILDNFRSYVGEHVFKVPKRSGLYSLTGRNEDNPRLETNGCGKSSLLDAIFWCLYGRTLRGLKAGDVVSWGAKSCSVTVTLTIGHKRLRVRRSQSPNGLTLEADAASDRPIEQDGLQKYLRLTPEAFVHSVILPQFGDSFFDLKPADKLTLFSEILELDYWLDKSKLADDKAKELAAEKSQFQLILAKHKGQIETIKDDISILKDKEANFTENQNAAIKDLERQLSLIIKDNQEKEIKDVKKVLISLEARIAKHAGKGLCPTCNQKVPNPDLKAIQQNKSDFEDKLRRLTRWEQDRESQISDLKSSISKEMKRENHFSTLIAEKRSSLKAVKDKIESIAQQITKVEEEHVAVSFWVTGFKRIRLIIVEESLRQLEIEVNNNLANLGLTDWAVEFDIERENKSGGITKGFVVLIRSPGHAEPVKFEAWSGGEIQRLSLAGDLGLANLIMEKAGLINSIEFFDEPSAHLSPTGVLDLAETLAERASDQRKRVFMVDHSSLDFGGFSGTITAVKDADGSRLEVLY
jgi:DNA repair exonuclease SbcCD ATPase subunit